MRLEAIVRAKGIPIHARIDHSGDAAAAGLSIASDEIADLRRGGGRHSADGGVAPTLAIDLPLKILVWQDENGFVWVSYNTPEYLQERHGFPNDLLHNIAAVKVIAEEAVR